MFRDEIASTQATFEIATPSLVFGGYRAVVATISYDPQSALVVDARLLAVSVKLYTFRLDVQGFGREYLKSVIGVDVSGEVAEIWARSEPR